MSLSVVNFERNLEKQIKVYKQIKENEQRKTLAITARDGENLEILTKQLSEYIEHINALESEREEIVNKYTEETGVNIGKDGITISRIISSMDEESSRNIFKLGMELRDLINSVKALNETNALLLKDNMELFEILLSNLTVDVETNDSYSETGEIAVTKSKNSILFNQTV